MLEVSPSVSSLNHLSTQPHIVSAFDFSLPSEPSCLDFLLRVLSIRVPCFASQFIAQMQKSIRKVELGLVLIQE
jgi:hypothetical protein